MEKKVKAGETLALLDELKQVAGQLGYQVRQERFLREVGYRVRSGRCRVRTSNLILIDRDLPAQAQLDLLIDELAGKNLEQVYVSPAARRLLEAAA